MSVITVVPGSTLSDITWPNVCESRLSTSLKEHFLLRLSIPPTTQRIFVIQPRLYFLFPKALSSTSTVSPTPPIFELFSINHTVSIFLNSVINLLVVFLDKLVSDVITDKGYFKIHATKTHSKVSGGIT